MPRAQVSNLLPATGVVAGMDAEADMDAEDVAARRVDAAAMAVWAARVQGLPRQLWWLRWLLFMGLAPSAFAKCRGPSPGARAAAYNRLGRPTTAATSFKRNPRPFLRLGFPQLVRGGRGAVP